MAAEGCAGGWLRGWVHLGQEQRSVGRLQICELRTQNLHVRHKCVHLQA